MLAFYFHLACFLMQFFDSKIVKIKMTKFLLVILLAALIYFAAGSDLSRIPGIRGKERLFVRFERIFKNIIEKYIKLQIILSIWVLLRSLFKD